MVLNHEVKRNDDTYFNKNILAFSRKSDMLVHCYCTYYSLFTDLSNTDSMPSVNLPLLDLSTLKVATENFAERNKIGEGGFGAVYKVLLMLYLGSIPSPKLGGYISCTIRCMSTTSNLLDETGI